MPTPNRAQAAVFAEEIRREGPPAVQHAGIIKQLAPWAQRLSGAAGLLLFAVLMPTSLDWRGQMGFGVSTIAAGWLLNRLSPSRIITLVLIGISLFSSVRYMWWRSWGTLLHVFADPLDNHAFDDVMMLVLLGAEFFALAILVLGYFQTIRPLRRRPCALPDALSEWPTIDVFVPTYNEPLQVVRHTVMAARHMDWPPERIRVHLLDDGRREEFREFCNAYGVSYMTRPDNAHAKAGNLNHALARTCGEYIAIFDCDHVPVRSFLQISMGWFAKDEKLALVQTPHHFYSPDPFERNLKQFRSVPNESELFYGLIQDGSDFWNAAFFCGSCAVIRRKALEEIGGIAIETVTEDAHTSLRLQANGWNTAYINIPQAAGLATESLTGHIGQRVRWARGMVQILRVDCPLLKRGLKLEQRLCYLNSILYFLNALPRLIFLTSPLIYLLFGRLNIYGDSLSVLAYALPHLVLTSVANSRIQGRYRFSFWNEIYETVLAPYILLPTWLALINPKLGKFNVTAKGGKVANAYLRPAHRAAVPDVTGIECIGGCNGHSAVAVVELGP